MRGTPSWPRALRTGTVRGDGGVPRSAGRRIEVNRAARIALAVVAALVLIAFTALCVQLALIALAGGAQRATPARRGGSATAPMPPGGGPMRAEAVASPARGTTGTIVLPPVPRDAPVGDDVGGTPAAAPFALRGIGSLDRARAMECLTAAIYYEAASEPIEGQRAVAQVVLNRVRHPAFPGTVCGVVYQGSDAAACQFSFACDGAAARVPSRAGWARAAGVAAAALNGAVYAPVGLATHYHTYAVTPAWNRTLVMTDAVGAHFFHRWKGYWGTAEAFTRRYTGGEPQAGVATVPSGGTAASFAPGPAPAPAAGATASPEGGPPAGEDSVRLPESRVLDRWKDAGKPLADLPGAKPTTP